MWILPTRSRPHNFRRAVGSYPDAPVLVVFTENDPDLDELESIDLPERWGKLLAPPDSTVPQILNLVFQEHPGEQYYGFIGDDVIPPKDIPWWDILAQTAGNYCFAYPVDSIHGVKGAPHFCIGGDLVRAVGWLAAPWFYHNFIDTTWFYLAKELGLRRIVPDIVFEHLHPLDKRHITLDDKIYRLGRGHYDSDMQRFKLWMTEEGILALAQEVREAFGAIHRYSA